ncbi:MAG: stage III sporulation protein AF [Eubacterium sp.]
MEQIFDIVKQVTGVMLIFSILLHIFAGTSHRRYLQFMEGLLIMLLVIAPFLQSLKKGDVLETYLKKYQKQWEMREIQEEIERIGQKREEYIAQEGKADRYERDLE